jgi:hypothetical protein
MRDSQFGKSNVEPRHGSEGWTKECDGAGLRLCRRQKHALCDHETGDS